MSARSRAASIAANERWSRTPDRHAATAPGLKAANASWEARVRAEFPDADDATVQKLADNRRRAHMARISAKGVAARRRRSS